MSEIKILEDLKVHGDLKPTGAIHDSGDSPGTIGQILQSTATGTDWVDGVDISAGDAEAVHLAVKNTSGATITKGTPVYITGNVGGSDRLEIAPADASDVAKMPAVGLLGSTLADDAEGFVSQGGYLKGLATDTIDGTSTSSNDTVYVKAGGGLTMTKPTGTNYIQNIAKVARVHASNGSLIVSSILRTNDVPTPLYIDHANQRLGIGATSPSNTLSIKGSVNQLDIETTLSGATIESIDRADTSKQSDLSFYARHGNHKFFSGAYTERMRIDSSGNVGIGTDSPDSLLNIEGTKDTAILTLGSNYNASGWAVGDKIGGIDFYSADNSGAGSGVKASISYEVSSGTTGATNALVFNTAGTATGTNNTERMRITHGGNVGIGNTNPSYKLDVSGDTRLDGRVGINAAPSSDYQLNMRFDNTNANDDFHFAQRIDGNFSGADNTDGDREQGGLYFDIDSSADGDASNEHKLYGIYSDVRFSGFSDNVYGAFNRVESNNNTESTNSVVGTYNFVVHDTGSSGGVGNLVGAYNYAVAEDDGTISNTIGSHSVALVNSTRTSNLGVTYGSISEVQIDSPSSITYDTITASYATIDNNEGSVPTATNSYLFRGTYSGTRFATNAYGLHVAGDKHYLEGNVGIGTTSPVDVLTLYDSDNNVGVYFQTLNSGTGSGNGFRVGMNDTHAFAWNYENTPISFGTNGSQKATILANGNVGIGTTSPGFKLEVSGDIRSTGYMLATGGVRVPYAVSTKKPMIVLNGATNYGLFHTEGSSDIFSFDYGGVPKQTFNENGNASFSGDLTVSGGDITLGGTGRIQGIDTVSSSTDAANKSYVDNNTAPAVSFTRNINSSTYSMLATVSGDRYSSIVKMTITGTSGNVVIASTFEITANHSQDIHVKSSSGDYTKVTIRISSDGNEDYSIEAKHNGSTTTEVEVFIYPLAGEVVTPTTTNPNYTTSVYEHTATEGWRFGGEDGNAESSNVIVDGKLGIGTTSPGVNFQVGDGTTDATSRFYYNDNTYTEINGYGLYMSRNSSYIRPTADNSKTLYVGTSDRQWGALSFDATNTYFNTNGSQRMRIDSSGRVGIGTDSPSKKLHVDSGTISDIARFENDNGVFTLGQTSFLTSLDLASSNAYRIRQGSDVPFYINASGNVGIGTTSPGYKLHVSGNSFIDATSASAALTLGRYSGQPTIKASTDDGGYLLMDSTNNSLGLNWYSNRNVVLVNGGGNVGIGTISPGAKLDVNGDYILNNQRGLMVRSIDESNYFSFNDESTTADFEQQLPKTSGGGSVAKVDDPTAPAPGCFEITGDYNSDIASVNRYIKIDVASEYTWEIYVKFVSGTDTSQSIYLGSGMWDADKNYFGNTQRYWGASNVFVDANSLNDDWHHIKGTIKGVGSNTGNFISGTEYIAPIALLNYGNNANVIRVCGLKLYKSEKSATSLKLNRYGAKNYYDVDTAYPEGRLKIENSGSDTLRARNDHGYIDIGPANSTYAHITTDRGEFYFNKRISVDEGIISSYNEDLKLRTGTTTAVTILNANQNVGIGTTSPLQKFHTAGVAYFSGGTNVAFQSGGDVHSNSAIVIDKGDKIKVRAGQYLRDLLHQDSTNNIIKIGQTGTALITGINLEAGHDGSANSAQVRVYGGSTEYVRFDGFNKIVGIGTTAPASGAKLTVMGNQTFGLPGSGSNTSGRFLSIEGNADSAGEGSGRIFFTEHNSSTAAMDKYGLSIGYRGGATSVVGASGNTWTGLSQIGNGEWGFFGHNNDATGRVIMKGARAGTNIDFNTNSLGNATYYKVTAGNGYGINFWNSTSYSIYMSIASSSTRLDTNSDYNMYFKMSGGTNRGFVFMNSGTPVAQIDSTGKVYAEGGLDVSGHVYAGQGVQTITSTSGTINLNARDYGIFKLSNDLTGATTFNLQYMKSGQVIDIIVSGSQVITFTSDDTSETFNKVGGVDYDGASDNHIQIVCIDSTNSAAIYNYTVGTYESDTTP